MKLRFFLYRTYILLLCGVCLSCASKDTSDIQRPSALSPQARPVYLFLRAVIDGDLEAAQACASRKFKERVNADGGWEDLLFECRQGLSEVHPTMDLDSGFFVFTEEHQTITFAYKEKPVLSYMVVEEDGEWKIDVLDE